MDNGGEQDQDTKESTSAPNDKGVSFTQQIEVVNSDPESGSQTDLETANVKGPENASDNTLDSSASDFSSDDKDVHVPPQVIPQPVESNNVCQSSADTQQFVNDKADVTNNALDSSDSKPSSDDEDTHGPRQVFPEPVESNNACQSSADTQTFGNHKADVKNHVSDSSDSNSSSVNEDDHVPHQVRPQSVESNNACQSNADTPSFGNDKAEVTDNAPDSSDSNSSSDDEDSHVSRQVLCQSEEPNNVCLSKAESTFRHSNSACEPLLPNITPMTSPPIQVMKKHQEESVSTMSRPSTPSKPLNWSTTSSESLFSIRFQNSSLSGDPVPTMDADLAKSENLHKSGELSISESDEELFPVGDTEELPMSGELPVSGEFPVSEKPDHSGELYEPMENFTVSDVTIQGLSISEKRASSVSKGEVIGLEYIPLRNTSSKKSSDGSIPPVSSSKSGANAQAPTSPPEKKPRKWPLCWPAFCPAICCCSSLCKCSNWPSGIGNCFRKKGSGCFKCSAPSCNFFKSLSCSGKCHCCCPGSSCWSFKCFTFSGNCCSCFSKCWCAKRR